MDFIKFRDEFFSKLDSKTTWGRNEIKEIFHITFENVISIENNKKEEKVVK
jgi:hypothetical protein